MVFNWMRIEFNRVIDEDIIITIHLNGYKS